MVRSNCRGDAPGAVGCENKPLPNKGYCQEHKKDFECNNCKNEVGKDYGFSITEGNKIERDHNQGKQYKLCSNC